ncbi:MAG: hypothetical protein WC851_01745 [Candidatus Shapirobacteria bacterium]|jgi:hypothetical protein
MKKMNLNQYISAIIALVLGILVGQNIDRIREFLIIKQLSPSKVCQYDGKTYQSGESFRSTDGCNSCGCNNGEVACTLMACGQP